jgi:hypothetical protein
VPLVAHTASVEDEAERFGQPRRRRILDGDKARAAIGMKEAAL